MPSASDAASAHRRIERIIVIANPASGQDEPVLAALNAALNDELRWDVSVTHAAGDAERLAREAAAAGVDAVAVYGGDGTLAEVVAGLEGTGVPLAILRGGTANVFAEELGVPVALEDAAKVLVGEVDVRHVDVGVLGKTRFLVRVGVGLEAATVAGATREEKDRLGVLAYPVSALRAAADAPIVRFHLTLDGAEETVEGVTCMIANAGSLGRLGLRFAPDISVEDGRLDVFVLRSAQVGSVLKAAAKMATGDTPAEDVAFRRQARELRVEAEPQQDVVCDGESAGITPIEATILPGAARVLVPRAS